jgi:hypothetical protein
MWAIPFLIYYGIGVGGTRYNKGIALTLRGNYTKRLYKFICSQRDREFYNYNLDQFRKDFGIPESYTTAMIQNAVLGPARDRIIESGSDVWFDYEMRAYHPHRGRKPKFDTIRFVVKNKHPQPNDGQQYKQYSTVYRWVSKTLNLSNEVPRLATDKIFDSGRLSELYGRIVFYEEEIATGAKTREHVENSFLKILREDFGVEVVQKKKVASSKKPRNKSKSAQNEVLKFGDVLQDMEG